MYNLLTMRSNDIHTNSYKDLLSNISYQEAYKSIKERIFLKKDLGISYRELNHWSTLGILLENNQKGKWRKFNVIELIWIEFLKELRYYNIPIIVLQIIKQSIDFPIQYSNVFEEMGIEELERQLKKQFTEKEYKAIINSKEHKQLKESMNINEFEKFLPENLFELFVLEAYFLKFQYTIIINFNGEITFSNELYHHEVINQPQYKELFERSHLSVSLNSLISRVFKDYSVNELKFRWKLINDDENTILDILQSNNQLKSINIKFNKDSKIDLLEYKEEIKVSMNQYLKNLLVKGAFEEIKVVTQNGQVAFCERTTKRKI